MLETPHQPVSVVDLTARPPQACSLDSATRHSCFKLQPQCSRESNVQRPPPRRRENALEAHADKGNVHGWVKSPGV
jgi:hypothetical protein